MELTQCLPDFEKLAKIMCQTKMVPLAYQGKPQEAVAAMAHGHSIGLTPLASLSGIAVVNGKPTIYGDAMRSIVEASGKVEYIKEVIEGDGDNMIATCIAKRIGRPEHIITFSVEDAKKAGLWNRTAPSPWATYPKRMLQMRARGFALRDVFSDVLGGLISHEEAVDFANEPLSVEPKKIITPRQVIEITDVILDTSAPAIESAINISETLFESLKIQLSKIESRSEFDAIISVIQSEHDKMTKEEIDELRTLAKAVRAHLENDNLFAA